MIARQIKEGHFEVIDEAIEFLPLGTDDFLIALSRPAGNQVADRDYEFRLEFVDLFDSPWENPGSQSTGSVSHNRELKIVRIVFELALRPRLFRGRDTVREIFVFFGTRHMTRLRICGGSLLRPEICRKASECQKKRERKFHKGDSEYLNKLFRIKQVTRIRSQ